jgi:trehalose synthase-fused probable maltokinase
MAPMAADAALDAAWLASRRWFRHKSQSIESLSVEDTAPLGDGCSMLVLAARLSSGDQVRYFAPAVGSGDDRGEPAEGDGAWRALLGWLTRDEPRIASERGTFVAHQMAGLEQHLPGGQREVERLDEHLLGAQQSNTSVRLGERLIMKLYRLVEPGINPEVELCAFLDEAGFRHVPPVVGWIEYRRHDGPPAAAAIVQGMVAARGDAWEWTLERLAARPRGPAEALAVVAQLGGITAELHAALRSRPNAPGFEAGPAGAQELQAWHAAAVRQLELAQESVRGDDARALERTVPAARAALDAITHAQGAIRSRIHGDYHLGQLLATESGFVVIDFEGEPARSLEERRRPVSPLRDVAGMLRSLDYAARTVEAGAGGGDLSAWLDDARAAFLAAYGDAGDSALLRALEVEKACYEVRYEANNRPDWTWLPLQALERLVA